jgi:segregation and condensation protein B
MQAKKQVLRYYESKRLFFARCVLAMTLKAKVEAVVYASEEPITLAQLAAVLANEVLEELAADDARNRAAAVADTAGIVEPELVKPELVEPELVKPEPVEPELWEDGTKESAQADGAPIDDEVPTGGPAPASEEAPSSVEMDEKRALRQRDRRIRDRLLRILNELIADYSQGQRGMEIREVAGGYRMATKPEYHDTVRSFVKSLKPPMKLSLQALETLAVVAYKQPVTAPEVSEIRGVDSGGVLGSLIGRKLIATAGRKHVIGRPILYKTTKEFLLRFGLKDLNELPSMEEFEKMAGELAQAEAEAEDAAMRSSDLPQTQPEPQPPLAGSDLGEASIDEEPAEENMSCLDIPPSPASSATRDSAEADGAETAQAENPAEETA